LFFARVNPADNPVRHSRRRYRRRTDFCGLESSPCAEGYDSRCPFANRRRVCHAALISRILIRSTDQRTGFQGGWRREWDSSWRHGQLATRSGSLRSRPSPLAGSAKREFSKY
jgi:hypothetical protein